MCRNGGWRLLEDRDGDDFDSKGDCVSEAKRRVVVLPNGDVRGICQGCGGTFTEIRRNRVIWTCNGGAPQLIRPVHLFAACIMDDGNTLKPEVVAGVENDT